MSLFLTALAAFGALLTAYFMYPQFASSAPTISIRTTDVPGCEIRGSDEETLQQKGFFELNVEISTASMPINCKSIEVKGAKIPSRFFDEVGDLSIDLKHLVKGKVPFPLQLSANSNVAFDFRIEPDEPENGILEISIRYSYWRAPLRAKCRYQKTHYWGE